MTLDGIQIITRKFNPTTDSGFIYSSFPKGVYYASSNEIRMKKRDWFEDFYVYLNQLLSKAKVYIACTSDDPDVILAYAILKGDQLEWCYTKELFRKQGLATLLLKNKDIKSVNMVNLTNVGADILKNHPEITKKEQEE